MLFDVRMEKIQIYFIFMERKFIYTYEIYEHKKRRKKKNTKTQEANENMSNKRP